LEFTSVSQALCDNWDQHWSDFSEAAEMGPAAKYRQRLCLRLLDIDGSGEGVRMLDIGSGTGAFAALFCKQYPQAKLHGLEMSQTGTDLAARRVPHAEFEQRDLLAPLAPGASVRLEATHAVCSEVLEHLDDPATLLRNATAYMAPNCRLIVTVPGGKPNAFDRHIGHRRHYTAEDLKQLLTGAGFQVESATGAGFPFFNLYRALTTWRGERLKVDVAGRPSFPVRMGMLIFGLLLRFNLMSSGWQTVAVARYRPDRGGDLYSLTNAT
jgi:trans-aconitate methyltransferase